MKTLFLLTVLIYSSIYWHNAGAQSVDWNAVEQHYFEVYQPTDTPQWIFPIIAINGDGQADTIYYCYKSYANDYNIYENEFGEKATLLDTSNFAFSFNYVLDSTYSVFAFGDTSFSGAENIGHTFLTFINGKYPLTLKWNGSKLYDTVLPFPNILPKPIARIGGFWAHIYEPFILGSAQSFIIADLLGFECPLFFVTTFIDSVTFNGPIGADLTDVLGIELSLSAHNSGCIIGSVDNIKDTSLIDDISFIDGTLCVKSNYTSKIQLSVYDIYGRLYYSDELEYQQTASIKNLRQSQLILINATNKYYTHTIKFLIK